MSLPDLAWLVATFPDLSDFQPLGQGGQKLVMRATHKTEGIVVLKLIHPRTDIETVRREILAVQQVRSPRVPRILEHGNATTHLGPCVWLREEFIDGETVRQMLARGPLLPASVLRLGLHVMEALEKAEAAQIVHRDVKPDNVMCDRKGAFWLLDFGIARHLDLSSLTATGLPFGKMTLGYAPPEQCRNVKTAIDSRADLFALGVTLHECGTGRNGFFEPPPRDQIELLKRVERFVLAPLELPLKEKASFRDLVQSMTQKGRGHRPRNVRDALQWIREICSREGVS
ncbi:MAG: serine/threonine-protein kinase [Bryobacteraceae bacterium]